VQDEVRIVPLRGIPDVRPGDDLVQLLTAALAPHGGLADGDVLVVTQKIVSKAEGRLIDPHSVAPSAFAEQVAQMGRKDAQHQEVVLRETKRIVRMANGVLICETHHGLICANAGVDESNVDGQGLLCLLPVDPDASAARLRDALAAAAGRQAAVIISDTFGRPWREGQVNVAIGAAGLEVLADYTGINDAYGYLMQASKIAVADELAAAAELVMGKIDQVPAALIRGYRFTPSESSTAAALIRDARFDLFR
jgi:coenzyme F420-0:L-glutamate ligase/coenzyme F420-1:gamma-L-glutamate ligase